MRKYYYYYLEIKNRCFLILLAWGSTVLVSYIYRETLLFLFLKLNKIDYYYKITHLTDIYFIFTDITEVFYSYTQISLFMGNHIILAYILYHLLLFLSLGLYRYEYNFLFFITKLIFLFWFISIILFSFVALPSLWHFFFSFKDFTLIKSLKFHYEAKLSEFIQFFISVYYVCFIYSQIFTILIIFLNSIKKQLVMLKYFRKFLYYIFIFMITLITPPDIFSQLITSILIMVSLELVFFSFLIQINLEIYSKKLIDLALVKSL